MRKTVLNMAVTFVVAVFSMITISSCVKEEYEISEENLNTEVTVFQEGLSLPLGKTTPVTLGYLYEKYGADLQDILKNQDGRFGFLYSGYTDASDLLAPLTDKMKMDGIAIDRSFTFDLSNVNLDGVRFEGRTISPEPINVSEMLDVPELRFPKISESFSFAGNVPAPETSSLDLDFGSLNMSDTVDVASIGAFTAILDESLTAQWEDVPMDYLELQSKVNLISPGALPNLYLVSGIEDFEVTVPIDICLPSEIKEVRSIQLNDDASVSVDIKVINPLFTEGSLIPHLDIDLHNLFHVDEVSSGVIIEEHIQDEFTLNAEDDWTASHVYHVDSLMLSPADWTKTDEGLRLRKDISVKVTGTVENQGLKTTLNHLRAHSAEPMEVVMTLRFDDFSIENVRMVIEPMTITKVVEKEIPMDDVKLPDVIERVDHIVLDENEPLVLGMKASVPDAYKALDIELKTLRITFPEGVQVNHENYDAASRTISFNDIPLQSGLDEAIGITRIDLPAPVGQIISYKGKVSFVAEASAGGLVDSRALMNNAGGDISVNVSVDYQPALKDYSIIIADYPYEIEVEPFLIDEKIPAEAGKLGEVEVYLEDSPQITISLDYPKADGMIRIVPDPTTGLRIFFPEMIRFKALDPAYNYDPESHSIGFVGEQTIPDMITLPVDHLVIRPQLTEGTEDDYRVKGEMRVEGGVCLKGMTIDKAFVDGLMEDDAVVSFSADVPSLVPAKLALDEYVASVDETIRFDGFEMDALPGLIKSVDEFELKDVYLSLEVDASSVTHLLEGADITMDFEVKLPDLIEVENAGKDNVLVVSGRLDADDKIVIDPVHVTGLDLSGVDFGGETITLGVQQIGITGKISVKNVLMDVGSLGEDALAIQVNGKLCTKGTESIEIGKVQAKVDYQMEPVTQTVSLTALTEGLPDGLSVVPDLNRFYLDLDLKTNLSLPVQASMSFVPYFAGEADMDKALSTESPLKLKYSDNPADTVYTRIRISNSDKPEDKVPDREHVVLDILSLLKEMPDSVQLVLDAGTVDNASLVLYPSSDYVLRADYALELPLELGDEFLVEFADTLQVPEMVSTILSYGSIGLAGEVVNSLPLQLEAELQLLDADGSVVPLTVESGKQLIKAGNLDGTPSVSELDVRFKLENGREVPQIDAVRMIFRASPGGVSGGALLESNFMQVELRAVAPEGATADLKDFVEFGSQE